MPSSRDRTHPAASARLAWMADVVAATPGERVLEVGCGHGVLVDLLVSRGCTVDAVDRSPTMVAATVRRNRRAVEAGRVRVQATPLLAADLADRSFDAVVSFDVRAFWTPPAPEWDTVVARLSATGRVVVGFSVMRTGDERRVADALGPLAATRGLDVVALHRGATEPMPSAAVELRAAPGSPGGGGPAPGRSSVVPA
ncbi:SAM-dependent methyltransferase [Blastococcus sp. SYSU D00868]